MHHSTLFAIAAFPLLIHAVPLRLADSTGVNQTRYTGSPAPSGFDGRYVICTSKPDGELREFRVRGRGFADADLADGKPLAGNFTCASQDITFTPWRGEGRKDYDWEIKGKVADPDCLDNAVTAWNDQAKKTYDPLAGLGGVTMSKGVTTATVMKRTAMALLEGWKPQPLPKLPFPNIKGTLPQLNGTLDGTHALQELSGSKIRCSREGEDTFLPSLTTHKATGTNGLDGLAPPESTGDIFKTPTSLEDAADFALPTEVTESLIKLLSLDQVT
jgi:hypothetical protein